MLLEKPKLNLSKIKLSDHATLRMKQRLDVMTDREALNKVRSLLGQASYIGQTADSNGNKREMFINNKIAIYLDLEFKVVITVIDLSDYGHYYELRDKIWELYHKEFRKVNRLEESRLKKFEYLKLKNEAEISTLKLRAYKTRSENVRRECQKQITKLNEEICNFEKELKEIESKKRRIAKSLSTVVV